MSEKEKKVKRKSISKKLRFEVFKRDSFTCQYCGAKAPDVLLHVDHITPVSKGGKNTLMNLVTACERCNLGKSNEPLDENTAVKKSQTQAALLQARREQIEMLRDWQLGLVDEMAVSLKAVNDLYARITDGKYCIREEYLNGTIQPLIKKFGLSEVLTSLREGAVSYGDPSRALDKIVGICYARQHPEVQKRAYIKGILSRKIAYGRFNQTTFYSLYERGVKAGGDSFIVALEQNAKALPITTWSKILCWLESFVADYEGF